MYLKVEWCAGHIGIVLGIGPGYLPHESEGNEERAPELVTLRRFDRYQEYKGLKGYNIVDRNFRFSKMNPKRHGMGIMIFFNSRSPLHFR